jgi:hypothetical protein
MPSRLATAKKITSNTKNKDIIHDKSFNTSSLTGGHRIFGHITNNKLS